MRRLERQWLHSQLEVHRQIFVDARSAYSRQVNDTKSEFHCSRIGTANTKLFAIVDRLSGNKKALASVLPDQDHSTLPDTFADFFSQKIEVIRSEMLTPGDDVTTDCTDIPPCSDVTQPTDVTLQCPSSFQSFQTLTIDDVLKIVRNMPDKTCSLDPIPTNLVKSCTDVLSPLLLRIVNVSFTFGVFPDVCKHAIIRPLLKKSGDDKEISKNYCPVINCPFLDKFLEKAALSQFHPYLQQNSLYGKFQSAYREGHSTETALLRVQNDVMCALNGQRDLILVLLDLSAAFDTIDHDILLKRLHRRFGIGGVVLDWLGSYLRDRVQKVSIGSMVSKEHDLRYGVPQGSVLGHINFR